MWRARTLALARAEEHDEAAADRQEVPDMCEEWWMWRRRRGDEEAQRLWDEFERTQPVSEPDRIDEREVTLEERDRTPTATET
jgi:hypothetical protein